MQSRGEWHSKWRTATGQSVRQLSKARERGAIAFACSPKSNEAIDANEAEAYKADTVKAEDSVADEAKARVAENDAEVTKIDEADEADLTDNSNVADKKAIATVDIMLDNLDEVDEAKNEIVEAAEVDDSNKAIESDNADEVKEAIALDEAIDADELETNKADLSVENDKFD